MRPLTLRPAAKEDAAPVAAIYGPYVQHGVASFELVAPTAEEMAARIAAVTSTYPWLVAEARGEVVGYAYAAPHKQRAAYAWTAETSVYVASASRGKGVGSALYAALLHTLERQGVVQVLGGITLPNRASRALHRKMGFAVVGRYPKVGFKHGVWWDVEWWSRALVEPPATPRPLRPAAEVMAERDWVARFGDPRRGAD